jgi:heat shock protein HslJ
MKKTLILVACALLLVLAGCGKQSVPEATEAFCQSLVAYGESLTALESLSPTSTVGEAKDAQETEQDARQTVEKAARNLREAKLDAIDQAWKALDKTVRQISNQDTLAEVSGQIQSVLVAVRAAYEQLGVNNCPDLFPAPAGAAQSPADQSAIPGEPITGTEVITGAQPMTATVVTTQTTTAPVTATVATTDTAAMPAAASPIGVLWQLENILMSNGSLVAPTDPALYTLLLQPDGTANATADCITGSGPYTITDNRITLALRYSGSSCPPPSIASQYTKYLNLASTYTLENGTLVILYNNGAGNMTFTQAAQ